MSKNGMPTPPGVARPETVEPKEHHELSVASEAVADDAPSTPVVPAKPAKKKIKVKALRAGYYQCQRRTAGDVFEMFENQLGTWTQPVDPLEKKKWDSKMEARRAKIRKSRSGIPV